MIKFQTGVKGYQTEGDGVPDRDDRVPNRGMMGCQTGGRWGSRHEMMGHQTGDYGVPDRNDGVPDMR